MSEMLDRTESLCPHCFRRIEARRILDRNCVFLEKECPIHGSLDRVLLWKNTPYDYAQWQRRGSPPPSPGTDTVIDCPFNCSGCSDHRQATCTAIIEVTHQCNLHCPICFASARTSNASGPDIKQVKRMLQAVLDNGGPYPLQFSGGEPTLRDDLPEMVDLARSMNFDHVQVNTNGIRLAQDAAYARDLADAGASAVFLQFDGLSDNVYRHIRGIPLYELKQKVIERCSELKLGVILVPTLVKGVNESEIGSIILFAKEGIPTIRGVHFQPMTYIGRYPDAPVNEDRLLISDILAAIEKQTHGELKAEHFIPPRCEESHCSFSAFTILGADGRLIPTTRFDSSRHEESCGCNDPARQSRDYVRSRWKYRDLNLADPETRTRPESASCCSERKEGFLERSLTQSLCISGMAFQDAWSLDLQRLQRCCVHVVTPEAALVPFCAYYLTDSKGQRLLSFQSKSR